MQNFLTLKNLFKNDELVDNDNESNNLGENTSKSKKQQILLTKSQKII